MSLLTTDKGEIGVYMYVAQQTSLSSKGEDIKTRRDASATLSVTAGENATTLLDQIDLPPDAKKALADILAGRMTEAALKTVMDDANSRSAVAGSGMKQPLPR